jgi:hypothetical protein
MRVLMVLAFLLLSMSPAQAGWQKTVTKGGKTTVTGDPETMAKLEKENKSREAYDKEIAAAPRRQASDPIRVVFLSPLSGEERQKQNLEGLHQALINEFNGDPVIQIVKVDLPKRKHEMSRDESLNGLIQMANAKGKSGDVYVLDRVGAEDVYGIDKNTKKLATAKAFVYSAEMRSSFDPKVHTAKDMGSLFQNVQIVKNLAQKMSQVIKNDIGPTLPASAAVAEINKKYMNAGLKEQTGIEEGDDAKTVLKKLFKPRQPAK